MSKQDEKFSFEAEVVEALPNAMFKVRLPNEQKTEVLAYVSGKMRMHYIRILPGDKVTVEISPYDLVVVGRDAVDPAVMSKLTEAERASQLRCPRAPSKRSETPCY